MKDYKTGRYDDFFWIEFPPNVFSLFDLLKNHSALLEDKYLAIVSFDSGPLKLVNEERDLGWYEKDGVAYSPLLNADLIVNLPYEQYDQWCLFTLPRSFRE